LFFFLMTSLLKNKVALVTGAAHRVGKAIALELARNGVHIALHYHASAPEVVDVTLNEIRAGGVNAIPMQADLRDPNAVNQLVERVRDEFGRLDILVNSASNFLRRHLTEVSLDDWNETLTINLTAPFLLTQAAAKVMMQNDPPDGVIINICDKGALEPWVEFAAHGISKAGLLALSKLSAVSLAPQIRTNAIIPGLVLKPERTPEERWQQAGAQTPMQRPGSAEDVARAVIYLAREPYINGAVINVDGGEYLT
jgi:pteridine reductase